MLYTRQIETEKKLLKWYSLIEFYAKNKNLKIEN